MDNVFICFLVVILILPFKFVFEIFFEQIIDLLPYRQPAACTYHNIWSHFGIFFYNKCSK